MYFKSLQSYPTILGICFVLTIAASGRAQNNSGSSQRVAPVIYLESTKEQDGLIGPVRSVRTETVKLETKSGRVTEGQRQLLEITTYNLKGERVDNASYPIAGVTGTEEYKYDDKGSIVEMILRSADGSIISKEAYSYERDAVGNWVKMTTSLALFEDGKLKYEPVEATYRSIAYFYDEKIAKLLDSSATSAPLTNPAPSPVATDLASAPPNASIEPAVPSKPPSAANVPAAASKKRPDEEKVVNSPEGSRVDSRAGLPTSQPDKMKVSLGAGEAAPNVRPAPEVERKEKASPPDPHKAAYNFYKSGREQVGLGNFAGAIQAYQEAIKIEPDFADVYLSLGHAYLKTQKPQEAIKAFKEAIRLKPEMEEAHYGMGLEYFRAGKMEEASKAFKKAVAVNPRMAKAHYGLALTYQDMGKQNLLLEEYRILQTLDAALAKKLADSFPEFNLPCGGRHCD
jgi:tetratricopeptide (TPR) repeat protein